MTRLVVMLVIWGSILGCSMAGFAQVVPESPLRIVALPPFQVLLEPAELAEVSGEGGGVLGARVRSGVGEYLAGAPEMFALSSDRALQESLERNPLFRGTLSLARQWADMGIEEYKRLRTKEAIGHLEKALQNFVQIHFEVIEPREVSEVLLYLSLAYLEDGGDIVRPLELMKMMIGLDPERVIRPGYYPDFIVQFYRSAREALLAELLETGPPVRYAREMAARLNVDAVVMGYVAPGGADAGGAEVFTYLYTVRDDAFIAVEAITLESVDGALAKEAGNRLMSRLVACLFEPREAPTRAVEASRGQSPFALQVHFAYATFLKFPSPIEDSFGNYGVHVGANFALTREFDLTGGLQVLNSLRDYSGILRDDFTTIRGFLGGQLGLDYYDFLFSVQVALELTHIGPIRAFGDKNCIAAPEVLCPGNRGTVVFDGQPVMMGINTKPRFSYAVTRALEAALSAGVSYYFYPLTDRVLNFPLTVELGVQYRF